MTLLRHRQSTKQRWRFLRYIARQDLKGLFIMSEKNDLNYGITSNENSEYSRFGFTTCSLYWCKTPENRLVHKIFRVNFISTTVSNFWKKFVPKAQQTPRQMWLFFLLFYWSQWCTRHEEKHVQTHSTSVLMHWWCSFGKKQNKTKLYKTKCVKITRLIVTEKDGNLFCTQIKHFRRKKDKLKIENRNQGVRKFHYSDIHTWALSIAHNKDTIQTWDVWQKHKQGQIKWFLLENTDTLSFNSAVNIKYTKLKNNV